MSGLGKGVASASIGLLLKSHGYKVTPVKCENYLNIDSGLINPIEHGDPFLCEDGTESDMDLGTYERFLGQEMGRGNFVTMGQIYQRVIDNERSYYYRGEDVEAIPHVVEEIIRRITEAGEKEKADIVLVELGGTAGEYQNSLYYEAARQMDLYDINRVHGQRVIHVHVSYIPIPRHIGEPKTKPTQLSIKILMGMGIQPDFLVTRCEQPLDQRRKYLLGLTCNVREENIIDNPDVKTIYELPLVFERQNFDRKILNALGLKVRKADLSSWRKQIKNMKSSKNKSLEIALVGKYFHTGEKYMLGDSYAALIEALKHAAWRLGLDLKIKWVSAEKVGKNKPDKLLRGAGGIIVPIGWGKRGAEGKITAARYARENKIPYLGLCYGMQLAAVEFARNVIGLKGANTTENDPKTKYPVVHDIPEKMELMTIKSRGVAMRLGGWNFKVEPGTLLDEIYKNHKIYLDNRRRIGSVRHRHRYEFNNEYLKLFSKSGMVFSAMSLKGNFVDWIELPRSAHPFYLATQGHPEYSSWPLKPHPVFIEFLKACL